MRTLNATDADKTADLAEAVRAAKVAATPLKIAGGGTRDFLGRRVVGQVLSVSGHRGIVDYDPAELVITARAGTPLSEIETALDAERQMLAFEPPRFGMAGTLGGMVATGLSGPRRPFTGAVRDFVLGARVLNGHGEALRFGGTVFKNVAGFDAFRLMAGAYGGLGVLLDISLRVVPKPRLEQALAFDMPGAAARAWVTDLMRKPVPLSGAFHDGTRLHLRLSGGEAGVTATARALGGETEDLAVWTRVRDLTHPAQVGKPVLWRIVLPQTSARPDVLHAPWDQGGGVTWLQADHVDPAIWEIAKAHGGHATLFRGGGDNIFQPLEPAIFSLLQRLKAALDPAAILNPGRMYEGL